MARELVDLCVLTPSDAQYLAPLMDLLEDGRSEGELAADLFDGEWNGSMQKLAEFARCSEIDATAAGN